MKFYMAIFSVFFLLTTQAFAAGNAENGAKIARKCQVCHSFEQGGKNKVGPHLWGVYNRPVAHVDGFKYSPAFSKKQAEGMTWDEKNLSAYLADPRGFIKGNKMAFAGVKNEQERADVIEYLKTLHD